MKFISICCWSGKYTIAPRPGMQSFLPSGQHRIRCVTYTSKHLWQFSTRLLIWTGVSMNGKRVPLPPSLPDAESSQQFARWWSRCQNLLVIQKSLRTAQDQDGAYARDETVQDKSDYFAIWNPVTERRNSASMFNNIYARMIFTRMLLNKAEYEIHLTEKRTSRFEHFYQSTETRLLSCMDPNQR